MAKRTKAQRVASARKAARTRKRNAAAKAARRKKQGQDVNVVHLQEKLQGEELPEEEEDARTSYSFF